MPELQSFQSLSLGARDCFALGAVALQTPLDEIRGEDEMTARCRDQRVVDLRVKV